jgi:hypothetical protein
MKTETRGRKPIDPSTKKVPVTIYLPSGDINTLGGIARLRDDLYLYSKTKVSIKNYHNEPTATTTATI